MFIEEMEERLDKVTELKTTTQQQQQYKADGMWFAQVGTKTYCHRSSMHWQSLTIEFHPFHFHHRYHPHHRTWFLSSCFLLLCFAFSAYFKEEDILIDVVIAFLVGRYQHLVKNLFGLSNFSIPSRDVSNSHFTRGSGWKRLEVCSLACCQSPPPTSDFMKRITFRRWLL